MSQQPPTPLELKLIAGIKHRGPITFRDFMQTALYDPEFGYYMTKRPKIGVRGDYYTSSNVTSAFGAVVAGYLVNLLVQTGPRQAPLMIVELGAGSGQLACDILTTIREEYRAFYDRLTYTIIEVSPVMRGQQREKLKQFSDLVTWCEFEQLTPPIVGIVFSNELFDALPVHIVRRNRGTFEEVYVTTPLDVPARDTGATTSAIAESGTSDETLRYVWGQPSTSDLADYVARFKIPLEDNLLMEIGLDAIRWLARISKVLDSGYLVTIDYGDLADYLYAHDRRLGTVRSFFEHSLVESPLKRVGEQDITASVNFSALIEYGLDVGLQTIGYERQVEFLTKNGLIERLASSVSTDAEDNVDTLKDRLAVKNLFVPGGVSDNFRVLVQRKANPQV